MTKMTAYSILEIDSEIEWLRKFGLIFKKEIEQLKQLKITLYENANRQSTDA